MSKQPFTLYSHLDNQLIAKNVYWYIICLVEFWRGNTLWSHYKWTSYLNLNELRLFGWKIPSIESSVPAGQVGITQLALSEKFQELLELNRYNIVSTMHNLLTLVAILFARLIFCMKKLLGQLRSERRYLRIIRFK